MSNTNCTSILDHVKPFLNPARPIVSIDLNNTIMDQQRGIIRASKGRLNMSHFAQWDMDNSKEMQMSKEGYLKWAWQNTYSELLSAPFPGAALALASLRRAGVAVWIVTATVMTYNNIRGWLEQAGVPYDKIIKTQDKRGLGDVLIDDSPMTCAAFHAAGANILRYELPWNKSMDYVKGVSWL